MRCIQILALALLIPLKSWANFSLNIQCQIIEKAKYNKNNYKSELMQLSDFGSQSYILTPGLTIDSEALYILSLSKANTYQDATGDEVGADYILSLGRMHNQLNSTKELPLRGKILDMAHLTIRDGFADGRLPSKLELKYTLDKNIKVNVRCEILNSRS